MGDVHPASSVKIKIPIIDLHSARSASFPRAARIPSVHQNTVEWKNSRIFFMPHVDQIRHLYSRRVCNIQYFRNITLREQNIVSLHRARVSYEREGRQRRLSRFGRKHLSRPPADSPLFASIVNVICARRMNDILYTSRAHMRTRKA